MTDRPDIAETLIAATITLQNLRTQVEKLEAKIGTEYVTARELKNVEQTISRLEATLKDAIRTFTDAQHAASIRAESVFVTRDQFDPIKRIAYEVETVYVTRDQFDPVKRLVYGMVGVILTSVVMALMFVILGRQG